MSKLESLVFNSPNSIIGNEINADGNISIDVNTTLNIYDFRSYSELKSRINEFEDDLESIEDQDSERFLKKASLLSETRLKLHNLEHHILSLAEVISNQTETSDRLKEAKKSLSKGLLEEADKYLPEEALFYELKQLQGKAKILAHEFLVKASIAITDISNPEHITLACKYYEASLKAHTSEVNLLPYAEFLTFNKFYNNAEKYYLQLLEGFGTELTLESKAKALNELGSIQRDKQDFVNAEIHLRKALSISQQLAREQKESGNDLMAKILNDRGILFVHQGRFNEALVNFLEVLSIRSESLDETSAHSKAEHARIKANLGLVFHKKGLVQDAVSWYSSSLHVFIDLHDAMPGVFAEDLAQLLANLGACSIEKDELEDALEYCKSSLTLILGTANFFANRALPLLARSYNNLAKIYDAMRRFEEACTYYEQAAQAFRTLAEEFPEVYDLELAHVMTNLGRIYELLGDVDMARVCNETAVQRYRYVAQSSDAKALADLASGCFRLGAMLQRNKGDMREVQELYIESLAIRRDLADESHHVQMADLAEILAALGAGALSCNLLSSAQEYCDEALTVSRKIHTEHESLYALDLARDLLGSSVVNFHLNNNEKAKELAIECIALCNENEDQSELAMHFLSGAKLVLDSL